MADASETLRVGLIGHGAIGSVVACELVAGLVSGVELVAVLDPVNPHADLDCGSLDAMLSRVDLVVETAGHGALVEHGPAVIASGTGLLILSVGALADDELHRALVGAGEGRLMYSTGAIGAIDALRAATLAGGLERVSMTSTKPSANRRGWQFTYWPTGR